MSDLKREVEAIVAEIDAEAAKRSALDPVVQQMRASLVARVERALVDDVAEAASVKADHILWANGFYKVIQEYRSAVRVPKGGNQQRVAMRSFIGSVTTFYTTLLRKLQQKYGVCTGVEVVAPEVSSQGPVHEPTEAEYSACVKVYQRCFVYLGDLARYNRSLQAPADARRSHALMEKYYKHASVLDPETALPYSQLGIIYEDPVECLYYAVRAAACAVQDTVAQSNLSLMLKKLAFRSSCKGAASVWARSVALLLLRDKKYAQDDEQAAVASVEEMAESACAEPAGSSRPLRLLAVHMFAASREGEESTAAKRLAFAAKEVELRGFALLGDWPPKVRATDAMRQQPLSGKPAQCARNAHILGLARRASEELDCPLLYDEQNKRWVHKARDQAARKRELEDRVPSTQSDMPPASPKSSMDEGHQQPQRQDSSLLVLANSQGSQKQDDARMSDPDAENEDLDSPPPPAQPVTLPSPRAPESQPMVLTKGGLSSRRLRKEGRVVIERPFHESARVVAEPQQQQREDAAERPAYWWIRTRGRPAVAGGETSWPPARPREAAAAAGLAAGAAAQVLRAADAHASPMAPAARPWRAVANAPPRTRNPFA
eukprot:m51a1_g6608 putative telomerase-binding protein est1a (604) ;mRNA; f:13621-16021